MRACRKIYSSCNLNVFIDGQTLNMCILGIDMLACYVIKWKLVFLLFDKSVAYSTMIIKQTNKQTKVVIFNW